MKKNSLDINIKEELKKIKEQKPIKKNLAVKENQTMQDFIINAKKISANNVPRADIIAPNMRRVSSDLTNNKISPTKVIEKIKVSGLNYKTRAASKINSVINNTMDQEKQQQIIANKIKADNDKASALAARIELQDLLTQVFKRNHMLFKLSNLKGNTLKVIIDDINKYTFTYATKIIK